MHINYHHLMLHLVLYGKEEKGMRGEREREREGQISSDCSIIVFYRNH